VLSVTPLDTEIGIEEKILLLKRKKKHNPLLYFIFFDRLFSLCPLANHHGCPSKWFPSPPLCASMILQR
jgi:hypothetical protein